MMAIKMRSRTYLTTRVVTMMKMIAAVVFLKSLRLRRRHRLRWMRAWI